MHPYAVQTPRKRVRKPTNLTLSPGTLAQLEILAAGGSRSATVERLVAAETKRLESASR